MTFLFVYTPTSDSALLGPIDWVANLLLGSAAIGLCVIAVAVVGLMLLSGRLPIRHGLRTLLGCFILLGAPVIAVGLVGSWQGISERPTTPVSTVDYAQPREEPPSAEGYDPYAGASLRRD